MMRKSSICLFIISIALFLFWGLATAQDTSDDNTSVSNSAENEETPSTQALIYQVNSATPVNARVDPSTISQVAGVIQPGSLVRVLETVRGSLVGGNSNWYRILLEDNTTEAYVHSTLLVPTSSDETMVTLIDLPAGFLPTITISAIGTASTSPDIAIVQFGFQRLGSEGITTYELTDTAVKDVSSALLELNIKPTDVSQSAISISTEDVIDSSGGGITGEFVFRSQASLTLIVRDLNALDEIFVAALSNGSNSINSVTMTSSDLTNLEDQARQDAVNQANKIASDLARQMNLIVGQPISITVISSSITVPQDLANAVEASLVKRVPNSPNEISATVEMRVEFAVQSK